MKRPNIILKDTCSSSSYTAPRGGSSKSSIQRDRVAHAKKLEKEFLNAVRQSLSRSVDVSGAYLEFTGSEGQELVTKSLEDMRQGIRLLNVRKSDSVEGGSVTHATVFIPRKKEESFLGKIKDYGNEELSTKQGKPRYEAIMSSIEKIDAANVLEFWTGKPEGCPNQSKQWVEIWLRVGATEKGEYFKEYASLLEGLDIKYKQRYILFPERMVTLAYVDRNDLVNLLNSCGELAEIKEAPEASSFFTNLKPVDQSQWQNDLLQRISFEPEGVAVCILDTGVNTGHPLLNKAIDNKVVLTCVEGSGLEDNDEHGTKLAGLALYGDLKDSLLSKAEIKLTHAIESVKILDLSKQNDPDLYGEITKQAIDKAFIENPKLSRLFCSGVTAGEDEITNGLPTSWSAALDEAISHPDDQNSEHELVLISAGNVKLSEMQEIGYPNVNDIRSVHSPGQAWNALTVGAYTENVQIEEEDIRSSGYTPVAKVEDLCPFSRTSFVWEKSAPIKPEILCPGGNVIEKDGDYSDCQDLSLLTTGAKVPSEPFSTINATSAAVAEAGYLAAKLKTAYPDLWAETIRGLLVHSARWSENMLNMYSLKGSDKDKRSSGRRRLLRTCGYGIADLNRAIECKENSVNFIIQQILQPYEKKTNSVGMHEMHIHRLPWPKETLRSLREADATLRVTLSYFIEPGPGEIGWKDKYRYASHGLRFDVNAAGENREEFEKRINVSLRDNSETNKLFNESRSWFLGVNNRNVGSIHSDFHTSSAISLSDFEYVAVYPVNGWWRSRNYLGKVASKTRYSLIVSIETPNIEVGLYSEIMEVIRNAAAIVI